MPHPLIDAETALKRAALEYTQERKARPYSNHANTAYWQLRNAALEYGRINAAEQMQDFERATEPHHTAADAAHAIAYKACPRSHTKHRTAAAQTARKYASIGAQTT